MNHHLLHKTKKHNYIKKKTRKYGKKCSGKKLSKRKRYTRKMLHKGGVKFSSGATPVQASFLNDFFPDEKEVNNYEKLGIHFKFPYNVTFDNKGTFMGADFRYYVPKSALLSSKKYKNLSLDEYSEIAGKQPTDLIQHRKNMITYFNAITRLFDALNDENGLLGCDKNIKDVHIIYNKYPNPDPRPSDIPNTLYQTSLMEISEDDLNRLLNNPDTSTVQKKDIKREIDRRNGYEVNSEYSPIIKLLNSNFWDFDRELRGRCIIYKRKLNGENITITCGHDGFYLACFPLEATVAGKLEHVGFTIQSQQSCQYVKIRFIILMICIMFDMNQVSREIQTDWFENIKNAEEVFISNAVALSSIQDETLETLQEKHQEVFQNYLKFMISIITDLFEKHPQLKNYMILEIDLYYLLITMEPRSFFQEYSLVHLGHKFNDKIQGLGLDLIISFVQLDNTNKFENNKFSEEDTQIINRLFDFKSPDSITKYLKNGVTTNIEVNENNELVLRQYVLFGMVIAQLPGYSNERLVLAIILDEKTVNITNSTYVSLSKFRWVFNTETQHKIYGSIGPMSVEKLFPYFRSIIPIDQLNPEQFNVKYDRAVLLYTGYVKNSLSMGPSLVRSVQNMFQKKEVPMTLQVANYIPVASTPVRIAYGRPNPRYPQAMLVSNTTQAVVDSSNTPNNEEEHVEV